MKITILGRCKGRIDKNLLNKLLEVLVLRLLERGLAPVGLVRVEAAGAWFLQCAEAGGNPMTVAEINLTDMVLALFLKDAQKPSVGMDPAIDEPDGLQGKIRQVVELEIAKPTGGSGGQASAA